MKRVIEVVGYMALLHVESMYSVHLPIFVHSIDHPNLSIIFIRLDKSDYIKNGMLLCQ